ncbi:hypothetical protein AB3G33_14040 [Flavobacterium sp. WC2421]|jgi:hypothetical protein|uniref:DUF3300 domain-containing protein n=3 Tax=unclassified Flavobacterium TaxID=196869 RepID=A0AB39W854_9FLAO
MKSLKLIAVGIILLISSATQAQVSVSLNIGTAPSWGPSGYANVDYYYLPDVQAYYDIRASQFIYFGSGRWVRSRYLPRQYRNYDLNRGYKVVLNDYHGNRPYSNFNHDRVRYHKGYRGENQRSIGYRNNDRRSDNHRYTQNRRYADNHRKSNNYRNERHDEGHGNSRGKGHGEGNNKHNNRRN